MIQIRAAWRRLFPHLFTWTVCALMALPVWAGDDDRTNGENACDDLGSICLCSEPLDNTDSPIQSGLGTSTHDPSDSNDTIECNGGPTYQANASPSPQMVAETDMPAGNVVSNVFELDASGSPTVFFFLDNHPSASQGTYCVRHYEMIAPDLDFTEVNDGGRNQRLKIIDVEQDVAGVDSTCFTQAEWWTPDGTLEGHQIKVKSCANGGDVNLSASGDTVTLGDCIGGWCRMELCTTLTPGGNFERRFRVHALKTGETETHTAADATGASNISITNNNAVNPHHQNVSTGSYSRRYSYIMNGWWGTSQASSTWISSACEVEGGCDVASQGSSGGGSASVQ